MTDRELLELAAKAAGIEYWVVRFAPKSAPIEKLHITKGDETVEWNPLTDDGDALRLAVELNLLWKSEVHYSRFIDLSKPNDCENTRRAIVRAAAEIGKTFVD